MNYDIVFLGGVFPKEYEKTIINNSVGNVQFAANTLQWKLIKGIDSNNLTPLKIINSPFVGSFPFRYKKMFIPSFKFSHHSINCDDENVGFLNVIGIKHFTRYRSIKKQLFNWSNNRDGRKKILIAYAMTSPFTKAIQYIKKLNPSIITILIVPDLPQYMNTTNKSSFIYKALKRIDNKKIQKNLNYVNKYVFLTKYMADFFNIEKENYTIIEGIGEIKNDIIVSKCNDEKIILYTGTLNEKYGIKNLVDCMKFIKNENVKLVICGDGDSKDYIANASLEDNRIIYKGVVNREIVNEYQKSASILVNPRQNKEEYTKYSFPSKIMEYLSTGIPVLCYKLDGIPDEYDDYLFYVDGDEVVDLAFSITKILELSEWELKEISQKSKDFIKNKKNPKYQTKKIFEMIGEENEKI